MVHQLGYGSHASHNIAGHAHLWRRARQTKKTLACQLLTLRKKVEFQVHVHADRHPEAGLKRPHIGKFRYVYSSGMKYLVLIAYTYIHMLAECSQSLVWLNYNTVHLT